MDEDVLLVAVGCGRLQRVVDIAEKHGFVVFGTMKRKALAGFAKSTISGTASPSSVYFYETG
jgi:hypothetical protein